ncbi:MAG: sugar ABC transporter substrate-binding protein, partial [Anaerolineales bacterium]
MSHLKKLLFLFVVAAMILTACQSAPAEEPAAPAEEEAAPAEEEAAPAEEEVEEEAAAGMACSPDCAYGDLVVGFLQTGSEGGWRAANTASFKETAEQIGLTLKFYDSQNDLAKQVAGFQQFIQDPEVNV